MHIPDIYIFILLGFVAGLSGGLLGIGGGSITLPILYFVLRDKGLFPQDDLMQVVIGTTFAAMCMNSLVSLITHHLLTNVRWKMFLTMLPSLVLGPFIGAVIANHLQSGLLRYGFGIFQCLIAAYFFLPRQSTAEDAHDYAPSPITLNIAALLIGTIGSILGIGGGVLLVPFLIFLKVPLRRAIGTSAAATFVMISLAALTYLFLGIERQVGPEETMGFIYLPAFLAIGLSSVAGAPLGAYLVQFIPTGPLKKIFAVAQAALGISLILN